ncbi:MAG TPA: hypothetical protein VMJ32_12825 [Pirellulales bacterium]|nr:hypothetical protein [Pirellulales bacterium]
MKILVATQERRSIDSLEYHVFDMADGTGYSVTQITEVLQSGRTIVCGGRGYYKSNGESAYCEIRDCNFLPPAFATTSARAVEPQRKSYRRTFERAAG